MRVVTANAASVQRTLVLCARVAADAARFNGRIVDIRLGMRARVEEVPYLKSDFIVLVVCMSSVVAGPQSMLAQHTFDGVVDRYGAEAVGRPGEGQSRDGESERNGQFVGEHSERLGSNEGEVVNAEEKAFSRGR
jgi:hypothetical protein